MAEAKKPKRKLSKRKKSSLSKISDKVVDNSIKAISGTQIKSKKNKEAKRNRKVYSLLSLASLLIIGFLLAPNLWPVNNLIKNTDKDGGTYIEGTVGNIGNLNPVFASESAERSVSKLIFSSLFKYDSGGKIVEDLAEDWSANEDHTIFTVKIKPDLTWTDEEAINADDVVRTYQLIQHPDTESPLRNNWRGVKVTKVDDLTVTFALANSYSPFIKSLVNPILPDHAFEGLPAKEVRLSDFSQQPLINSGPFAFRRISADNTNQVELVRNNSYHGELPNIEEFIVRGFSSTQEMLSGFNSGQLSAMAGVDLGDILNNDSLRSVYESENSFNMPQQSATFLFMKMDNDILKDVKVRKAISRGIDTSKIATDNYSLVYPLNSALLPSQFDFSENSPKEIYDQDSAKELLDDAGWKIDDSTGLRTKEDAQLRFDMFVQNSGIFPVVAQEIAKQLFDIGVLATVREVRPSLLQQNHILPHNYDAIIFGFEGTSDPDVFPLWHSSQTGTGGYNLSEISDTIIDETLEAGRTRSDETLKTNSYNAFLKQWHSRIPAVPLYQPNYIYITKKNIKGISNTTLSSNEDRLNQISDWYID